VHPAAPTGLHKYTSSHPSLLLDPDGERCAETLKSLFENAEHPEKVIVGLSEHVQEEDKKCLELYCQAHGAKILRREVIRADMTKVIHVPSQDKLCPHMDQIRLIATFHVAAKGPIWARSLVRKVLGNEEYCMQVDAHTSFIQNWDTVAKSEWKSTNNEFAIISNPPALKSEQTDYEQGGSKANQVPRSCRLAYKVDNGFPDYNYPAHSWAEDLEQPLLSHAWSSAFSIAKCHLEESAPYDSFSWYAKPVEKFSRFSRFWTRGYVVFVLLREPLGFVSSNNAEGPLTHNLCFIPNPDTTCIRPQESLPFTTVALNQMATATTNGSIVSDSDSDS
jgi:hypothetical protein